MTRRTWIGYMTAAALWSGASGLSAATADEAAKPPDLTGEWRLDAQRSDLPQRPEGARPGGMEGRSGRGGGWGGGGWGGGGRGGMGGGRMGRPRGEEGSPDAARPRPVRLPERIHVTETGTLVSIEDSTGVVLEEIATVPAQADTFARAPGAPHVPGQWVNAQLVVERPGGRGGTVTDSFSLEDNGATLVVRTRMELSEGPARELKRVYRKVTTG